MTCSHTITQGREGEKGSWCVACGEKPAGVVVAAVDSISDAAMIKWTSDYRPKVGDLIYTTPATSIPEGWQSAFNHYERALKASWPDGAKGDAFNHWNEARKALLSAAPKHKESEK